MPGKRKVYTPIEKYDVSIPEPSNQQERLDLCGWGPDGASADRRALEAEQACSESPDLGSFFIAGQTRSTSGQTIRGWDAFRKVTGKDPNLVPQPTGNCVAAAADDIVELTQCVEILAGDAERFEPIYDPYHYATGRVLIGRNRLRGGAGSFGSWQASALKKHGVIRIQDGLPRYTRGNVNAWGDDRKAEGKSFRDYLDEGSERIVREAARVTSWTELRDALGNWHFATIASSRGYTMKPQGGEKGFHRASGSWAHQMGIWGYSEVGRAWVAIKNQWGNVHGRLRDFETGELWPPGFLRVPLEEFESKHLRMRGCECFVFSRFDGFPEQTFDFSTWG